MDKLTTILENLVLWGYENGDLRLTENLLDEQVNLALSAILTAIRTDVEGMKKEIIAYTPNDPDRVHNRILNDILEKLK